MSYFLGNFWINWATFIKTFGHTGRTGQYLIKGNILIHYLRPYKSLALYIQMANIKTTIEFLPPSYTAQKSFAMLMFPDGRIQRVTYNVDGQGGFVAHVTYETPGGGYSKPAAAPIPSYKG